jgi:hypothetical protein
MTHRIGKSLVCSLGLALVALPLSAGSHTEAKPADQQHQGHHEMSAEDQQMMQAWEAAAKPGEPHQRLAAATGTWKASMRMWMGPGEPQTSEGTSKREMILDGRVMADHFEGNVMGQPFTGHGMTGYDNVRKMYWSTWNDSMSTGLMTSWGKWDDAENALVMEGEMSDPMTGQPSKVKMISRYPEAGKEVFEMWEPRGEGGAMIRTMEITYTKM